MVIVRFWSSQRLELVDDRLHVAMRVAFGEQVSKEVRQRGRTERGAQIRKRVAPAIADTLFAVGRDAMLGELPAGVIAGAREHQRGGTPRLLVMHPRHQRRANRTSNQDGASARR